MGDDNGLSSPNMESALCFSSESNSENIVHAREQYWVDDSNIDMAISP